MFVLFVAHVCILLFCVLISLLSVSSLGDSQIQVRSLFTTSLSMQSLYPPVG